MVGYSQNRWPARGVENGYYPPHDYDRISDTGQGSPPKRSGFRMASSQIIFSDPAIETYQGKYGLDRTCGRKHFGGYPGNTVSPYAIDEYGEGSAYMGMGHPGGANVVFMDSHADVVKAMPNPREPSEEQWEDQWETPYE